jgi:hypothetical protein
MGAFYSFLMMLCRLASEAVDNIFKRFVPFFVNEKGSSVGVHIIM